MPSARSLIVVLWLCSAAFALPQQINYQGTLARPDGSPLDTTVSMTFTINYAPSGGAPLWTETQPAVVVANGLFAVQLGSVSPPLPDVFSTTVWLGIAVGGDAEMTPRQPINAVAYSYRVGTVDGASGGSIGGDLAVIGKGKFGINTTNSGQGTFVAGQSSHADATYSSVSGGTFNWALGNYSHVGGGQQNQAGDGSGPSYQTVSGGVQNYAFGLASTVGGGFGNRARGNYSFIGGGGGAGADSNSASGAYSAIGGGYQNTAGDSGAAVGGGQGNAVLPGGVGGAVGGGIGNSVSARAACIPGGERINVSGPNTFACGTDVHGVADHSFAFSDGSLPNFTLGSGTHHTFITLASNGYQLFTASNLGAGVYLAAGGSGWNSVSDSTRKENFRPVNTAEVLDKISKLPISEWNYKTQSARIRHMGPMAQDFHAAFQLGESDTTINSLDPDGVALAAIQELAKENLNLKSQNSSLEERITRLESRMQGLMADKQPTAQIEPKGR